MSSDNRNMNRGRIHATPTGLHIEPPHRENGEEPLFRVVYIIDLNAADPLEAARYSHRIMTDPDSLPPALHVIDPAGRVRLIDLSEEE